MKSFQKGELKTLWPFYLDSLISPLLFFAPVFMIVYFGEMKLSFFAIGMFFAASNLFSLIFEIPTGAIADIYGRKFSVLFGYFLEALGFGSLFFIKNYYGILLVFAFLGFATTFSSGSKEAWVTDEVKGKNKKLLKSYFVKSQVFDGAALILSGFLGAYLVKLFGVNIIWIAASLSFLISFFALTFAREKFVRSKLGIKDSIKDIKSKSIESIGYSRKHPVLYYFLFAGAILIFVSNLEGNISWVPFLQNLGLKDYVFGYLWSAMCFMGMIASIAAGRWSKDGNEKRFIFISIVLYSLCLITILLINNLIGAIIALLIIVFLARMRYPVQRVYFQRFIPSKMRATIGSVESMIYSIIAIIAVPLAGLLVDKTSARLTIALAGIFALVAALLYYKINEEKK
jgi:DHA3 family tetracycline resistance protein-like MFS transporter